MLAALSAEGAEYLLIGAHALAAHRQARATKDMDLLIDATPANARRVLAALRRFGAHLADLTETDLTTPEIVFQVGVEPNRIDFLTSIPAVDFRQAWERRIEVHMGEMTVPVIGREDLIRNKLATGRPQDLADVARLEGRENERLR
ncbi:MAG: nucleotidyltransferase [Candidatus Sericytochromatia bacterium]|nr:nucleotidyltransferase [Candidatus Tanganyikabacteria bacterium]